MRDLCWPCQRCCRRQKIRENSGNQRRPEGGHLFPGRKNRDQTWRRRFKAARHRSEELRENLSGRDLRRTGDANFDDASARTWFAPRRRHYRRAGNNKWTTAAAARSRQLGLFLVLVALWSSILCGCNSRNKVYEKLRREVDSGDFTLALAGVD